MSAKEFEDRRRGSPAGEEELRFIRNFHDIFLSIGIMMFAAGLGIVSSLGIQEIVGPDRSDWRAIAWMVAGVSFVDAAIMWLMAEFFARTRRLFLPSIVILIVFVAFVVAGVFTVYVATFGGDEIKEIEDAAKQLKLLPLILSGGATLATFGFYLRTRLPFAMGFGALALAAVGVSAVAYHDPQAVVKNAMLLQLAAGLFMFALGVFFDARDPERRTRLSDNGFWLHFFAAPMIFAAVISMTTGGGVGMFSRLSQEMAGGPPLNETAAAATTLTVVIVFALISLLINRRALLVAGLLSAAVAMGVLISKTGLNGAWTAALTLLLLGGAMVLLGGGWHAVRRVLVAPFPKSGLIARIIPPEPGRGEETEAADE